MQTRKRNGMVRNIYLHVAVKIIGYNFSPKFAKPNGESQILMPFLTLLAFSMESFWDIT